MNEDHAIHLSTPALLATRKIFDYLTENDLKAAGFDESEMEAFQELYTEVQGEIEESALSGKI